MKQLDPLSNPRGMIAFPWRTLIILMAALLAVLVMMPIPATAATVPPDYLKAKGIEVQWLPKPGVTPRKQSVWAGFSMNLSIWKDSGYTGMSMPGMPHVWRSGAATVDTTCTSGVDCHIKWRGYYKDRKGAVGGITDLFFTVWSASPITNIRWHDTGVIGTTLTLLITDPTGTRTLTHLMIGGIKPYTPPAAPAPTTPPAVPLPAPAALLGVALAMMGGARQR